MADPDADREARGPLDADSDNEDGPEAPLQGQPRRERLERIALFDFLRLVAGNRDLQPGFRTVEELVNHLKANDTITSDAVSRAMLACPRDLFVPPAHRGEALADRPIRVAEAGFNISAPHVQAVALQALALDQGQRVLDVGCGCGIVTAYAAYLTGSSGDVVGIDIRDSAINLATSNLQRLIAHNIEFSEVSAPIRIERHNVFIPLQRHRGRYDAVHVGGAMPASRLGAILDLLGPKFPDGTVRQRVLSQVSFSELEIPRDVEVVRALLEEQAEAARRVEVPASTFASDLAGLGAPGVDLQQAAQKAAAAAAPCSGPSSSSSGAAAAVGGGTAPVSESSRRGATNGVRPRSQSSLEGDHTGPATLPPAHRASSKGSQLTGEAETAAVGAGAATSSATAAGGGVGGHVGTGLASFVQRAGVGGWGWQWERPAQARTKAKGQDDEATRRSDVEMDEEAGEEKSQRAAASASAEAPAGPVQMEKAEEEAEVEALERRGGGSGDGDGDGGGLPYLAGVAEVLSLGPTDCELEGDGWRLPAHKAVLQARCELLRAQLSSGMRDSDTTTYRVPEAVERRDAVEAFLNYVYKDCLPDDVDMELVPQLLHAGIYFGCHRRVGGGEEAERAQDTRALRSWNAAGREEGLVRLCESLLARELVAAASSSSSQDAAAGAGADPELLEAAVAAAGPLLALADEGGLDQLRRVAMQFVLDHFPAVSVSEGYRQLPRPLVDEVAREALARYNSLLQQLAKLGDTTQGLEDADD
ncbi:hypothetical protein VOLCADRAFT_92375 [Volvox carteri f. nagariensis]|uniref:protein-L-isoaspartate(D-aspartate) O-methyltransferase n=1 Tax=Volvox carteri f. nagariensis TaxID=3068 RepID=D8TZH8_VOLCA|nr:uncharacterized protein VOLCADRAFT_92375 [Volvox carteri f. nagariensis]EFJ47183.1 hypothetical protein VOLCADRAFT_92375 [Volvox carteri f. nagariensis]|eukprot:XP_002951732.1 hypothetical protein VOLCADRAFT_92375 [Volvox carteri f. nagariensis]